MDVERWINGKEHENKKDEGGLTENYRLVKCLDRVDVEKTFPLVGESRSRGHSLRIKGRSFKKEMEEFL